MINKEQVAVVVPAYKTILSETEQISLSQLFNVLGSYDIYYAVPQSLQAEYLDNASIERFADSFFENIAGYNQLMLSKEFYRRFNKYNFILIYQLDAFVFSDCLLDFCNLDYDYIGAPWLTGMRKRVDDTYVYVIVGNGGFSLRNVQSTIHLLDTNKDELKNYCDNEDKFFAYSNSPFFKVAPVSIALSFAFERQVKQCFELNNRKIPFGCHAWERYDYDFWKPYIEKFGYELSGIVDKSGIEDLSNAEFYRQASLMQKFWAFDQQIHMVNADGRKVVVFGAGMYGKRTLHLLEHSKITVECIIDNNEAIQNEFVQGYMVCSPRMIKSHQEYFTIISMSGNNMDAAKKQLDRMGKMYKRDYITFLDLISGDT